MTGDFHTADKLFYPQFAHWEWLVVDLQDWLDSLSNNFANDSLLINLNISVKPVRELFWEEHLQHIVVLSIELNVL